MMHCTSLLMGGGNTGAASGTLKPPHPIPSRINIISLELGVIAAACYAMNTIIVFIT